MIIRAVYGPAAASVKRDPPASVAPGRLCFADPRYRCNTPFGSKALRPRSVAMSHGAYLLRVRQVPFCVAGMICLLLVTPSAAKSLPAYAPINPIAQSRSGVYFQPYREPRLGHLSLDVRLDYGSAIEYNLPSSRPSYLLDAEILRLEVAAARDLNQQFFLFGTIGVGGAYAGFLDGFLNWYHGLLGLKLPERTSRPNNSFAYQMALNNGLTVARSPSDLFLNDLRLGAGYRPTPWYQGVVTLTLPTSTAPDGYGRGTISLSALNTFHTRLSSRFTFEGALGLGWTPTHGDLSPYQETVFASLASGLRFRFWGRQSLFATVFYHSPYYHGTTLPALDRRELSLDFGWLLATKGGSEWRIGMTEDLEPSGPAIDIIFRLGGSF